METLKKARITYKNGTSLLDLVAKLIIKVVELTNKNLLNDAERVNHQITVGDLSKLKKFSPVLIEPLKNYMTLTSSFSALIASSHSANYDRKMIIKTLLKHLQEKTKDDGKRSDYLTVKVNALEKHFENALDHLGIIITTIKYFAGMYVQGAEEKEEADEKELDIPEVKNLSGIVKVLESMKKKLESHYSEIKAINIHVRQLFSKKGSYENMLIQQYNGLQSRVYSNLITGGVDPAEKYHLSKTYIIGGDGNVEMYVGGHLVEQDIDIKTTWLTNYQENIEEQDAEYAAMMNKKIDTIFGGVDIAMEMDDDDYFEKLLKDCKVDEVLEKEIDNILSSGFLDYFRNYYFKHKRQYIDSTIPTDENTPKSDEYFNFDKEMGTSVNEKLEYITEYMTKILDALDKIDVQAVLLKAKTNFKDIKDIDTSEQLDDALKKLQESKDMAVEKKALLFNRRNLKNQIRKYIQEALEETVVGGKFKKLNKPKSDAKIGKKAKYLLNREMSVKNALSSAEHQSLDKAKALCQAIRSVKLLISPDNKDSCICKSINLVKGLVYSDVLEKLLQTRFKAIKREDEIKKAKNTLIEVGELNDVLLYDGELQMEKITEIATKLLI